MKKGVEKEKPIFLMCGERQDYMQGNPNFQHGDTVFW